MHISFCKLLLVNIQDPLPNASRLSLILFDILLSSDSGVCSIWSPCWMRLPTHTLSRSPISPSCQGAICYLRLAVALPARRPWCFLRNFLIPSASMCEGGLFCSEGSKELFNILSMSLGPWNIHCCGASVTVWAVGPVSFERPTGTNAFKRRRGARRRGFCMTGRGWHILCVGPFFLYFCKGMLKTPVVEYISGFYFYCGNFLAL